MSRSTSSRTLYVFLILWLMLRGDYGDRLRDFAERVSRFWLVRAAVVIALFFVTLDVLQLPFSLYRHHISLEYGLSVQQWGSWFGDWAKGLVLSLFVSITPGMDPVRHRCAAVRGAGGSISGWPSIPFFCSRIFIQPTPDRSALQQIRTFDGTIIPNSSSRSSESSIAPAWTSRLHACSR